jgi:hypothetical protein
MAAELEQLNANIDTTTERWLELAEYAWRSRFASTESY